MKIAISQAIIGILIFSGICTSPLSNSMESHDEDNGHSTMMGQMQPEKLACCENHLPEASAIAVINTLKDGGNFKIVSSFLTAEIILPSNQKSFARSNSPSPPAAHKYLASIMQLE